jgi:predicted O-methyltransferase YrrM
MCKLVLAVIVSFVIGISCFSSSRPDEQKAADSATIDARVRTYLESRSMSWRGMSVPDADGQALHDIVLKHGYKKALEIGTSTGRSAIWIAWALSKTGGKLVTIEIDRDSYEEALGNFSETGLSKYIDARLGDAHKLVPELPGPFDFVFCDADKEWYSNYLEAALPKLTVGGCFAAHNVSEGYYSGFGGRGGGGSRRYGRGGSGGFLEFARSIPSLETSMLDIRGSAGMSVSYKKAEK